MDQLLALKVFVRIAETGAFARAADSLDVPRPTASKLIQQLERRLSVRLLQRTTRRVSVTPEGAAYYERAARLVAELDDMDAKARGANVQPGGRLRVDVGSSIANQVLLPALPGFRALYPELHVDLGVSDRTIDIVGDGVDCAIRAGVLADSSFVARHLAELEWVTVASPRYLAARGTPRRPDELRASQDARSPGHAVFGYFSSQTGRAVSLMFERDGERLLIDGRAEVAVNESTAHLTGLVNGLGVGQTYRFMAEPYLATGALVAVLARWTRPATPLALVYPSSRQLSAKVRVFTEWVATLFAPLGRGTHRS